MKKIGNRNAAETAIRIAWFAIRSSSRRRRMATGAVFGEPRVAAA